MGIIFHEIFQCGALTLATLLPLNGPGARFAITATCARVGSEQGLRVNHAPNPKQ